MNLIYTKGSSTKHALFFLLFFAFGIFALIIDENDKFLQQLNFWWGCLASIIILIVLFIHSIYITRRGIKGKQLTNISNTARSARFMEKSSITWLPVIVFFVITDRGSPPAFFMGSFLTALLLLAVAILLDNYLIHGIFVWNNPDSNVRKAYFNQGNK